MKSLRIAAALLLIGSLLVTVAPASAAERLPNIIFLMADDMGSGDLGCYNADSKIPTPHMDRLAAAGRRFTDAHSPSAVCTPTRYGVLTGRYAWRTRMTRGVLNGNSPLLIDVKRTTVASLLREHGYATACIGKWHLGMGSSKRTDYAKPLIPGANAVGFDFFFGIPASLDMEPYVFVRNEFPEQLPTARIGKSREARQGGAGFWRGGPIATSFRHVDVLPRTTDEAVAYLDVRAEAAPKDPFFLYLPLSAPHTPWLPTEQFRGKSGAGPYGDFTHQVDATVGRIADALERNGLTENTLFIVTADNGAHWTPGDKKTYPHLANHPWRGQKSDIWEGGHRVPFIASWPGKIEAGSTSDETICHVDLLATVAAIVGAKLDNNAGEDSYNVLPALLGEERETPIRDATVHHSGSGFFAIRQGDWKLVLGRGSGGFSRPFRIEPKPGEAVGQLYNLADDPAEANNLYQQNPEVVSQLGALLDRYRSEGRSTPPREG